MMELKKKIKTHFNLSDEQIEVLFQKFDELTIARAFDKTKTASRDIFKMNLKICKKYYV